MNEHTFTKKTYMLINSQIEKCKGPRDLGKYKISSYYSKNWPLLKLFDLVKVVGNVDISNLEPKNSSAFLLMFSDVTFHIETFSTNMTYITLSI